MASAVRCRFAPSPTGFLHLGGFRTALINYLFAKKHNGTFILRIEDTDQTRLVPKAAEKLEDDLKWVGLLPDESPSKSNTSFGPYFQSQRLELYHQNIGQLVDKGFAYECFCSESRLELLRKDALRRRETPKYDNKCRHLSRQEVKMKKLAGGNSYCIRFKMNPENVKFNDLVYGDIAFNLTPETIEGDPILIKSDGFPTYHFANVVDDHFMEISHILRGHEWLSSAPKHLQLYKAFEWEPPKLAHLPLIINKDGTKLSKRQGDISMESFKERSYYPLALVNFITKVGGGFHDHNVDKIYSLEELVKSFELSRIGTNPGKLDMDLLEQLNQLELKRLIQTDQLPNLVKLLREKLSTVLDSHFDSSQISDKYIEKIILWSSQERISTLNQLATNIEFSYLWSSPSSNENIERLSKSKYDIGIFESFMNQIPSNVTATTDDKEIISKFLKTFTQENNLKPNQFMRELRFVLCGIEKGPPIVEIITLFGSELTRERLNIMINILKDKLSKRNEEKMSIR